MRHTNLNVLTAQLKHIQECNANKGIRWINPKKFSSSFRGEQRLKHARGIMNWQGKQCLSYAAADTLKMLPFSLDRLEHFSMSQAYGLNRVELYDAVVEHLRHAH